MHPKNGPFVRPFLFALRSEIERQAVSRGLAWRTDSSNAGLLHTRNRIRSRVLAPLKEEYGESMVRAVCRAADAARETEALLEYEAEKALQTVATKGRWGEIILDICLFSRYFTAVQKAVLRKILRIADAGLSSLDEAAHDRILRLAFSSASGKKMSLFGRISVMKSRGSLVFLNETAPTGYRFEIPIGGTVRLPDGSAVRILHHEPAPDAEELRNHDASVEYADGGKLHPPVCVRTAAPGDRWTPLGMRGEITLKEFFIDHKVPNYARGRIPLVCDARGPIWIAGVRLGERVRVTESTTVLLRLELQR
jgi:tRNA(Ile)-lysidine synthase